VGASDFLVKDTERVNLIRGIQPVAQGDGLLSAGVTRRRIAEFATLTSKTERVPDLEVLTEREREVMTLVAAGLSNGKVCLRKLVSTMLEMLS
jgi:DNA-binding NarL/FixJ family response regulator